MRTIIIAVLLAALPGLGLAAETGYHLDHVAIDLENHASLQRGAKLYVNYCQGCHSLDYQRYNRLGRDIGLTDELVRDNLIFTGVKVGDTMRNAMRKGDAKQWFGAPPPDLSLIARSRGTDYLYTYLRTFYLDDSRPWGVNNAVFPSVGMPHVLWQLQGWQRPILKTVADAGGEEKEEIEGFELVRQGSMTPAEFDAAMADLVSFLAYVAEPVQLKRQQLGVWVIGFLLVFLVVAYYLKQEYWKDVH